MNTIKYHVRSGMHHDFPKTSQDDAAVVVFVWARIVSFLRRSTCVDRHITFAYCFSPPLRPHEINSNALAQERRVLCTYL